MELFLYRLKDLIKIVVIALSYCFLISGMLLHLKMFICSIISFSFIILILFFLILHGICSVLLIMDLLSLMHEGNARKDF